MPKSKKKKLRPVGEIMCDMEKLLFELHLPEEEGGHDMQHQEVLGIVHWWQRSHVPGQEPKYTDETLVPEFKMKIGWIPHYGPTKRKDTK